MGGFCSCNNPLINELATDFVEALPALGEVLFTYHVLLNVY